MPKNRMSRGLVALSATAVAAVYMAGYLRTQAADSAIGAASLPTAVPTSGQAVVAAAPAATVPTPRQVVVVRPTPAPSTGQRPTAQPTPAPTGATSAKPIQTQLKDGTFNGQGTSRRGDVWVSVQIQGGQIANVTITRSTLQYPLRDIAGLPAEVVQRQSAQVDVVSRATYSSMAFRGAVTQALTAAHA